MKLRKSLLILSASAILSAAVIAPDVALAQPFPGPPPGGGLAGPASPVVPPGHGAAGIADDMVRKWIEFKASAGVDKSDRIKALTDKFEAIRVQADIKTHIIHALGYGRSHLYLDTGSTDDKEELKTDLGTGARSAASAYKMPGKQLLGIRPIEPVWVSPHDYETSNPLKPNWYKPNAWHVMSNEVHASRLLTTIPFPVSDLLKPAYSFGGLPLIQLGKPYVDNWLNVRQGTTDIVLAYSIFALATEMGDVLSGGAGDNLEQRVALFNKWRSNKGTFVYDKNKEDFKNISANVAGIEAIQAASQEHMSAAWRIPLVKLTGISPSGLNASSEGEIRVYYDLIHSMQEQVIRPHIQIIMDLCSIELFGDVDDDISFDFVKLFEVTELEAAQIRSADAQTGSLLMQGQVISGEEERARVAEDPDTPYVDLDPLNPPQAAQLQPGQEGYQGHPDAWTQVMSGIADTGGLLPPPAPDGASSPQAWGEIMHGIATTGGVGHQDDGVAASPQAWEGLASGLAASGGVKGKEPPQRLLGPPLAKALGKDGQKVSDDQFAAAFGMDDFSPDEPRKGAGEAGGGEWTKGASGGASTEPKKGRASSGQTGEYVDAEGRAHKPAFPNARRPGESLEDQGRRIQKELADAKLAKTPPADTEGDTPEAKAKTARIRKVAESMGLDAQRFYYGGPAEKVNVAGVTGETLGVAFERPEVFNGKRFPPGVVIFDPPDGKDIADGTIAHEGMHKKFTTVMNAMADEAKQVTPSMTHSDGTLLDDPGLRKQFPIYAALAPYIAWGFEGKAQSDRRIPDGLQKLAREDGLTPYSSMYWENWYAAHGNMDPWLPINETLAEVSRVNFAKPGDIEGMPADYPERMKRIAPTYQGLFKAFNDAYEIVKARKQ